MMCSLWLELLCCFHSPFILYLLFRPRRRFWLSMHIKYKCRVALHKYLPQIAPYLYLSIAIEPTSNVHSAPGQHPKWSNLISLRRNADQAVESPSNRPIPTACHHLASKLRLPSHASHCLLWLWEVWSCSTTRIH